ncbi:SIMPL domain-containing protein [Chloroflexota bacterium]
MKRKYWLPGMGLVLLLTLVGLVGCTSGTPSQIDIQGITISNQQGGISVSGEGKVTVVPDIATLRLGIEAQETTVAEAQTLAAGAMEEVMSALTSNGIAKKDIQTQYFNIQRVTRWDRDKEQEVVTGYRVTNIVTAKIRDTEEAGTIIDDVATAAGDLTRIDNISFSVEDPSAYYEEARDEAIADAEEKAKQLAEMAGVTLGKATYISESTQAPSPIYRSDMAFAMKEAVVVETAISPGETEISMNVQINYAIN